MCNIFCKDTIFFWFGLRCFADNGGFAGASPELRIYGITEIGIRYAKTTDNRLRRAAVTC